MGMMPQAFTNLMESCNKTILALEACITAADVCEDLCESEDSCSSGAQEFVKQANNCIEVCQNCIKICDEMIVQFKDQAHIDHVSALDNAVKSLGECIRALTASIETCTLIKGCRSACQDARDACEKALIVVDECIESCEKHEIRYTS